MKKIKTALILVLVLALSAALFAGCGEKTTNTPASQPPAPATDSSPPANASSASTNIADYWTPDKGAPTTYDANHEVYTMPNRIPFSGIYMPPEASRAALNKAVKALDKKDNVTIGYATWTVGTPFFAGMMDTIKEECDKFGWTLITAVSDADVGKQIANIENFITLGVDLIVDNAHSAEAEAIAVKAAVDAGIPVVGLGLSFPEGTPVITNCATMFYEQGFMVGIYVAEHFKGQFVKGAISPGMPGHAISDSKMNGFIGGFVYARAIQMGNPLSREDAMLYGYRLHQQTITSAKFSDPTYDWEIVASIDGWWSRDGGQKAAEDILTAHPDIQLLYTGNDEQAMGAILALQNAGLTAGKDVQLACVGDGSKDAFNNIKDGKILCLTLSSPYTWCKATTDLAYKIFVEGFDATNLPSEVYLENVLVDKTNVDKYMPTTLEYSVLSDQVFTPLG